MGNERLADSEVGARHTTVSCGEIRNRFPIGTLPAQFAE